ncbi:MAG: DUF692 family multinuclear iron-containing protein [Thermaurantiacus sp.]
MPRPSVGLLWNPACPQVLDTAPQLVDFVEVVPDRLWYDFGEGAPERFFHASAAVEALRRVAERHAMRGHGIGLSLPSAMPLDEAVLDQMDGAHRTLGFAAFSEHLSLFLVPGSSVPNAQAGLGLPVLHDEQTLDIVAQKVRRLQALLGIPIALENGTIFTEMPDPPMTEPAFLNRLHAETGCNALLDLHNLHANVLNLGWSADAWLEEVNPAIVTEIHVAGGDWLHGVYTDSHSNRSPGPVQQLLEGWAPRFPNLEAITFEYHESYHRRIGTAGVVAELEWMHAVAERCATFAA